MRVVSRFALLAFAFGLAFAQGPGPGSNSGSGGSGSSGGSNSGSGGPGLSSVNQVTLKIPDETAVPGGIVQMKFLNTEPTPISTGRPHSLFDASMFDDVLGIELFHAAGDLNGVAIVNGNAISVNFECSGATQGTDYPVMTVALHVRSDALPGQQSRFSLDPSSTFTVNYLPAVVRPVAPATITVAGSVSIMNVVPGGGQIPAGTVVKILGVGFQPRTQVQLNAIRAQSVTVASSTEIDVVLAQPTNMTGQKIQVVNPDGSQDTYFSYMRGMNLGASNQPLLSSVVPIFSSISHSLATFWPMAVASPWQFTGLAMQNQSLRAANVKISLYSLTNQLLGNTTISLPSGFRAMRELSELTGRAASLGNYVVVSSDQPIQVFAFVADTAAKTVTPFPAVIAQP